MLSKTQRLQTNEFDFVYKKGKNVNTEVGYFKIAKITGKSKISCTVAKGELDKSTHRTRVRRRGYSAVEKYVDEIPSGYGVIWFLPKEAINVKHTQLKKSVQKMIQSLDSV
jgi:ribonuclease P protein component